MPDDRPPIPAALERALMIEAGYRCAVCKVTDPLVIDHITEWARVQKHEFENMIVLCSNCHGRKKNTSDPRHINRASLQKVKSNRMLLNGRYSDLERRIIDKFRDELLANSTILPFIFVPARLELLVRYLILDGFVTSVRYEPSLRVNYPDGTVLRDDNLKLTLTPQGQQFIANLDRGTTSDCTSFVHTQGEVVSADSTHLRLAESISINLS